MLLADTVQVLSASGPVASMKAWYTERRVSGDQRAGSWPRDESARRQWEYMRTDWPVALVPLGLAVIVAPAVLLLPPWSRSFAWGVLLTSGMWGVVMTVVLMSGAAPQYMGRFAEQHVAGQLREARRRGWHLANHVSVTAGAADVDHLVVGPAGVLVVETKYKSDGWGDRFAVERLTSAASSVSQSRNKVVAFLQPHVPRDAVRAVVVVMGRTRPTDPVRDIDGVSVVPAARLEDWVAEQADDRLGPDAVVGAWAKVLARVDQRDRQDRRVAGPRPLGLWDMTGGAVCFFLGGFVVQVELLRLFGPRWFLALGALSGAAGLYAHRRGLRRTWVWAWSAGTQLVTAMFAVAYIVTAVTRAFG